MEAAVADLARSGQSLATLLPAMQSELAAKADSINTFATDIGDATENYGGVPGGNAVTMRWRLASDEALSPSSASESLRLLGHPARKRLVRELGLPPFPLRHRPHAGRSQRRRFGHDRAQRE